MTLRCGNVRHMPTAAVNGIQVSYADSGGDGPAVVLSHGYLMDASMFDAQVAALAPEYRVITWDQRGHGGTPAPGPFSYWDSAGDVLALLDHLGIEQAVLGGMSQGGFLSLRAALLAPQRARGLVLIDSQAGTEEEANRRDRELPARVGRLAVGRPSKDSGYGRLPGEWRRGAHGPAPCGGQRGHGLSVSARMPLTMRWRP